MYALRSIHPVFYASRSIPPFMYVTGFIHYQKLQSKLVPFSPVATSRTHIPSIRQPFFHSSGPWKLSYLNCYSFYSFSVNQNAFPTQDDFVCISENVSCWQTAKQKEKNLKDQRISRKIERTTPQKRRKKPIHCTPSEPNSLRSLLATVRDNILLSHTLQSIS